MTDPLLFESLIKDFQEQKKTIQNQIETIDPIATSIRKPAATRLFNSGFLVFLEIIVWLLFLLSIAIILFLNKLFPFHYLDQIAHDTEIIAKYNQKNLITLEWYVKGVFALISILFFLIARMLSKIRMKNSILNITGKSLKIVVEQLLTRKAAMETLEMKFPIELPKHTDNIVLPIDDQGNKDILL